MDNPPLHFCADDQDLSNLLPKKIVSEFNKIKNKILDVNEIDQDAQNIYNIVKQLLNEDEYIKFEREKKQLDIEQKKKELLLKKFEILIKSTNKIDPHFNDETKEKLFNEFKNNIEVIDSKKDEELLEIEKNCDKVINSFK